MGCVPSNSGTAEKTAAKRPMSQTKVGNMGLTVYYHPLSQPSRSVYMFCKLNKIPFAEKVVDLMTGENRKEAYMKINPNGAVPAIVDDDFSLSECMTILKYLARKYKVASNWYPSDLKTEARVNEYLDWHHTGLRSKGVDVYMGMVLTPMMTGTPIDEESLAKNLEKLDKSLGTIEKTFLGDKKFIAGDEISIADLCAINEMTQVFSVQRTDLLASYPKLQAWRDRVYAQLKMDPSSDELHSTLRGFAAQAQK